MNDNRTNNTFKINILFYRKNFIRGKNDPRWKKHRGVDQRNLGLQWLRSNLENEKKGVVYFADDDNTYHLDLFKEVYIL